MTATAPHFRRLVLSVLKPVVLALLILPWLAGPALASGGIDGRELSVLWSVPFIGILLSIALAPLFAPMIWNDHYGKITAAWTLAFFVPYALTFGFDLATRDLVHALVAEYIPFILLLTALFTVSGGIYIRGNLRGTPVLNTGILLVGAVLASFMGTTGASMLLIRPLIRANEDRRRVMHVVIFFIFIVSNIGGSLTPLGDPPLFLGFLKGVTFFWTMEHLIVKTVLLNAVLLVMFFFLDSYLYRKERAVTPAAAASKSNAEGEDEREPEESERFGFDGGANFGLLAVVVALVLMSGMWKTSVSFDIMGTEVGLPGLLRDLGLIGVTLASLAVTPGPVHQANQFSWAPMEEVGKLFAGIFLTIVPVIAMLQAGTDGPFAAVVHAVTRADGTHNAAAYFWATGTLSAFLDNAPTYLVFYNTAGGVASDLMGPLADVLVAISAGSVFMGAMTYIGNAPNLMVKAIAEDRGVSMPSFFGYMVWSCGILLPLYAIMTWMFLL